MKITTLLLLLCLITGCATSRPPRDLLSFLPDQNTNAGPTPIFVPDLPKNSISVSILDFEAKKGVTINEATLLSNTIRHKFSEHEAFNVLDKRIDTGQYLVIGEVFKAQKKYYMEAKLIEKSTGKVIRSESYHTADWAWDVFLGSANMIGFSLMYALGVGDIKHPKNDPSLKIMELQTSNDILESYTE